jgi:Domain of unknown function (DUF4936)
MSGAVLYVYYKVPVQEHALWANPVRAFQAALVAQWPGLKAELLQRPEAADGKETWMEIYQHLIDLTPEMMDSIQQHANAAGLPMPRHTEQFIPLR